MVAGALLALPQAGYGEENAFPAPGLNPSSLLLTAPITQNRPSETSTTDENAHYAAGQVIVRYRIKPSVRRRSHRVKKAENHFLLDTRRLVRDFTRAHSVPLSDKSARPFMHVYGDVVSRMVTTRGSEWSVRESILRSLIREREQNGGVRIPELKAALRNPKEFGLEQTLVVEVDGSVEEAIQKFSLRSTRRLSEWHGARVKLLSVSPNRIMKNAWVPNDARFSSQYSLAAVGAPDAWNTSRGHANTVVAIIDSGIDYLHPDLKNKVWVNTREIPDNQRDDDGNGFYDDRLPVDFVGYTGSTPNCDVSGGEDCSQADVDPMDKHGHGTHVAGIIGAEANNGIGIAGVCPDCTIMGVRAGYRAPDGGSWLMYSDTAAAMSYAINMGADILNMSFGGTYNDPVMQQAVSSAASNGVVLIGAAGNTGRNEKCYPAAYPQVISVAATDSNNRITDFSTYGSWVKTAAPGRLILSTLPNGSYAEWNGTSMAAPIVAGIAGIIWAEKPAESRIQIENRVVQSNLAHSAVGGAPAGTGFTGWGSTFGIANINRAVTAIHPPTPAPTATRTSTPTKTPTRTPIVVPATSTPTLTATATATATRVTAASTSTPTSTPTRTPTIVPPTATRTSTPTKTATPVPTVTRTPVPPTPTRTPVPPTPTRTPVPPTPTRTPVPPTPTHTPTATPVPVGASCVTQAFTLSAQAGESTSSSHEIALEWSEGFSQLDGGWYEIHHSSAAAGERGVIQILRERRFSGWFESGAHSFIVYSVCPGATVVTASNTAAIDVN